MQGEADLQWIYTNNKLENMLAGTLGVAFLLCLGMLAVDVYTAFQNRHLRLLRAKKQNMHLNGTIFDLSDKELNDWFMLADEKDHELHVGVERLLSIKQLEYLCAESTDRTRTEAYRALDEVNPGFVDCILNTVSDNDSTQQSYPELSRRCQDALRTLVQVWVTLGTAASSKQLERPASHFFNGQHIGGLVLRLLCDGATDSERVLLRSFVVGARRDAGQDTPVRRMSAGTRMLVSSACTTAAELATVGGVDTYHAADQACAHMSEAESAGKNAVVQLKALMRRLQNQTGLKQYFSHRRLDVILRSKHDAFYRTKRKSAWVSIQKCIAGPQNMSTLRVADLKSGSHTQLQLVLDKLVADIHCEAALLIPVINSPLGSYIPCVCTGDEGVSPWASKDSKGRHHADWSTAPNTPAGLCVFTMRAVLIDNIWLDSRGLDHKGLDFGSLSQMCLPVMMAGEEKADKDQTKSLVAVLKLLNKVLSVPVPHTSEISTAIPPLAYPTPPPSVLLLLRNQSRALQPV